MKFTDICEGLSVFPGEYVLHKPSAAIVMAGSFSRKDNLIRAFREGKLFEDAINNFQKIELSDKELAYHKKSKCKKCKGGMK